MVINITCITAFGYFNIWIWDKTYSIQHEMVITVIYKNVMPNYRKIAIKWLETHILKILVFTIMLGFHRSGHI